MKEKMIDKKEIIDEYVSQLRRSYDEKLYYLTLMGTVCIIDICSSIDDPDEKSNKTRFKKWYEKYLPEYSSETQDENSLRLTGDRCYRFRCKLLHEGLPEVEESEEDETTPRAVFSIGGVNIHHSVSRTNLGTYYYVSIRVFMEDVVSGVYEWLEEVDGDKRVDECFDKLLKRRDYDPGCLVGGSSTFYA